MKYVTCLLSAFLFLSTAQVCSAQHDTATLGSMSLKDLLQVKVTTASKTLQELDFAPATVVVITKEQIVSRGYQSLLDLLTDLQDVKVDDKIYSGSGNSIVIRGIQGQQNFFILLDGIKISSPTNEALPIMENYPIYLAEQVEIVYGPASALYGADAVAGVINIISKKINSKKLVANASTMAGMYGYTNSNLYLAKKLGKNSDIVVAGQYCYNQQPDLSKIYKDDSLVSVAHYGTGNFNTIFGPMSTVTPVRAKYEAPTTAYNLYAVAHLDNFTLSLFSNYTRTPSSWGNNTLNAVYNKEVYMGQSVTALNTGYKKTFRRVTSTSFLTASRYYLDPNTNYRNLYSGMEPVYKYSTSLSVKAEQQVDYTISRTLNVTGGITHERIAITPQSADLDQPVNTNRNIEGVIAGTRSYYRPEGLKAQFYNIMYSNSGVYLQTQYAPGHKVNLTLGARYDYNSRYKETFNPRLGIAYKPTATTTIKALYGSAFMAPPPSTAYVTYGTFETKDSGKTYTSSFLHLANPDLEPIISHSVEMSVNQYLTRNLMLTVDGYYTQLSGLFNFADDNNTTQRYHNMYNGIPVDYIEVFVNDDRQVNYGGNIQLKLKHAIGNVFFNSYANLSYINGYVADPDYVPGTNADYKVPLPFISTFMFRIGTDMKAGKFSCSPRLLLAGKQNLTSAENINGTEVKIQQIPGYALLNIALRYEFSKRLAIFANVTNALNQRYRLVSFNMDLHKSPSDVFYGQPADPIRVAGGINFNLAH